MQQHTILLVEDSAADAAVVLRAIEKYDALDVRIEHAETANDAMQYLSQANLTEHKHIMLVDVNLPMTSGFDFLLQVKALPEYTHVPIIVWSTSDEPRDIKKAYELSANTYVVKPMTLKELTALIHNLCHYWFSVAKSV